MFYSNKHSFYLLNDSATFLWRQLQQNTIEETLKQALQNEYGIEEALAEKAVKVLEKTLLSL